VVLGFCVTDTGAGIPADMLGELFRPFSQLDASTTRRYGGTGLGLAISQQLVSLMGGRIGVESEVGRGSRFWFTSPFGVVARVSEAAASEPGLRGERVLVLDGHPASRGALIALLRRWGCLPVEAADAAGALALLREAARAGGGVRAALLDEQAPGEDCRSLAHLLQDDPLLADIRPILIAAPGPRGAGPEPGFAAVISRPVRGSALKAALRAALGRGGGAAAPSDPSGRTRAAGMAAGRAPRRILVAEDSAANVKVVLRILEKLGYRADAAADGEEVVEALSRHSYDLVLMDCRMPGLDGIQATREIRRREGPRRRTTIVAVTAEAMKGDREACLEAGMDDYLMKPFGPEELARVLERWLPAAAPGTTDEASPSAADDAPGPARRPPGSA
jgi:CheY-like chemotaxis protein